MSALLEVSGITAFYGASQALFGVDLIVNEGEAVALMGRNGMGKTTTIKTICRMMSHRDGEVRFADTDLAKLPSHKAARLGIGLVPEGRRCFARLSVMENLMAAARAGEWDFDRVADLFPRLAERRDQKAMTLSGGEQQMLAIARALMGRPKLLLLDEPSLGLAPLIVKQIFAAIKELNNDGLTVFLVEQNAYHTLKLADRGYVMVNGKITMAGTGAELLERKEVRAAYLEGDTAILKETDA